VQMILCIFFLCVKTVYKKKLLFHNNKKKGEKRKTQIPIFE